MQTQDKKKKNFQMTHHTKQTLLCNVFGFLPEKCAPLSSNGYNVHLLNCWRAHCSSAGGNRPQDLSSEDKRHSASPQIKYLLKGTARHAVIYWLISPLGGEVLQLRQPFAGVFVLLATSGAVSAYCLSVVTVLVLGIQINLGRLKTVYSLIKQLR